MLKLGIIGIGNIGTGQVKHILAGKCPEIELTAVADRSEERRQWAKENIPGAAVFNEGSELIHSGLCEAVVVSVPHYQHPELSIEAMKAGLHVVSEKPAGVYTLQVREMIAEADRHPELTFAGDFCVRTNSIYKKMKELLDAGAIGELKRVNWIITTWYRTDSYYSSGSWRATWSGEGGGVLLNQCPHNLDLLQWLCGMPCLVRGFCHEGKWHDIEVEDDVTAYLEFPNGATGAFITTTGDTPGTNRLEITGTKGRLICENDEILYDKLEMDEREFCKTSTGSFKGPGYTREKVETDGSYPGIPEVFNRFASHILRGEPLIADGREGINSLLISNAIHLSSWLGKPVSIPFDEELFKQMLFDKFKK